MHQQARGHGDEWVIIITSASKVLYLSVAEMQGGICVF